ncbi:hypothetical protein C8J57DRAFT_1245859 [Mycena rebaudengoi]|nr:hypothetical protein C8J57DRAFT_1245859 [Mycena rebaudengoi]
MKSKLGWGDARQGERAGLLEKRNIGLTASRPDIPQSRGIHGIKAVQRRTKPEQSKIVRQREDGALLVEFELGELRSARWAAGALLLRALRGDGLGRRGWGRPGRVRHYGMNHRLRWFSAEKKQLNEQQEDVLSRKAGA